MAQQQRQAHDPGEAEGDGQPVPDKTGHRRAGAGARSRVRARTLIKATAAGTVLILVGTVLWQGANTHTGAWFGHQISHGPRDRNEVALTFDDGPNSTATVPILDALEARGVKGTFFMVGRAVAARPDLAVDVARRGHLVANHSYRHDSKGWLDPRYPELARTQRVLSREAGVCPAFYRPPHGQHTPLLARVVGRHGMTMIGWDTSAGDWSARDPEHLARRILAKVRPGSIVDLHDGLDGLVNIDRTVLVDAMPFILDGLKAKGLTPVRLDELLGRPGYLDRC
jgi:peptidoglycan-N-acetylglucosamine deacetylase